MPGTSGDGGQQGGQGDRNSSGAGDSNQNQVRVMVGDEEKIFSSEDVKTLVEKSSRLENDLGGLSAVKKVLAQYDGLTSEEYVRNSEAAFAIASKLIEEGIIDKQGNIIKKTSDSTSTQNANINPSRSDTGASKQLETVLKAVTALTKEVDGLKDGQSNIYRRNISRDVKAIHSNLNDDDVSQLLAVASHDKSKSFFDHAKEMSENKTAREGQHKTSVAKEVIGMLMKAGIVKEDALDLDKLNLDELSQRDKEKLSPIGEGKTFVFNSRKKKLKASGANMDVIASPSAGMREMIDRNLGD